MKTSLVLLLAFQSIRFLSVVPVATDKTSGALSPDSKSLAYIEKDGIHLRELSSGKETIIAVKDALMGSAQYSPAGDVLYYMERHDLYRVSLAARKPAKVIENLGTRICLSSDGQKLAFGRGNSVIVASADGAGERQLASWPAPAFISSIAWSPDGARMAALVGKGAGAALVMIAGTGAVQELATLPKPANSLVWTAGNGLLLIRYNSIQRDSGEFPQSAIWQYALPSGPWTKITHDDEAYFALRAVPGVDGELQAMRIHPSGSFWDSLLLALSLFDPHRFQRDLVLIHTGK